ncbi:MAG: hypothetical protein HY711_01115, partial [Candidatus Melainabacteria bacterium]|nr:hypothetical protein [Candidatus Melainabacteria bacterium]
MGVSNMGQGDIKANTDVLKSSVSLPLPEELKDTVTLTNIDKAVEFMSQLLDPV